MSNFISIAFTYKILWKAGPFGPLALERPKKPSINRVKKLLLLATSQTYFIFNSTCYNQIDGVTLGFLLVLVLADIFMAFFGFK